MFTSTTEVTITHIRFFRSLYIKKKLLLSDLSYDIRSVKEMRPEGTLIDMDVLLVKSFGD